MGFINQYLFLKRNNLLILENNIVKAGTKIRVDIIQPIRVTAIRRPKYLTGV